MSNNEKVIVKYNRESAEVHHLTIGAAALPEIRINRTGFSDEELRNDHYGARLLCAAALSCFTNTFANSLIRNGANLKGMTAWAEIEKDKDEVMRTRYTSMSIHVEVDIDESDLPAFEKAKENMERGSLVTYSLEDAMEMEYDMRVKGS
ncbi:MAG: OsmC family protein [Deltaproteobacteria bacterium]|nr:OsmC family protein [Deltaproteobacteria bacterium]MBW2084479.1 OsmC family protein [Deltaproteobacteria bacterium]